MKMTQKDYLVVIQSLVTRHQDTHSEWERTDILATLRKLLTKVKTETLYTVVAEKLLAEVDSNRADVLASLAQNPEVVHSTIAD